MNKVLLVSWLILIVAACTPAELQTPITDTATSTSIPTATITVTPLVALPQPTESLETTTTTSPANSLHPFLFSGRLAGCLAASAGNESAYQPPSPIGFY